MRRVLVVVFGVLPSTVLAFFAFLLGVSWFESPNHIHEARDFFGLGLSICGLSGAVGLWVVALRKSPAIRNKGDAMVLGLLLFFGIVAASYGLLLPDLSWRLLAISPILTALTFYPGIVRALISPRFMNLSNQSTDPAP